MARLELASWCRKDVQMTLSGAIPLPEPCDVPCNWTRPESSDSAICIGLSPRPRTLGGHSGKYLMFGGPGFSVASFDAMAVCVEPRVERIPVPFPSASASGKVADTCSTAVDFTLSPVQCMTVVGESQVWVGAEAGSLHVFEISTPPSDLQLRFASHATTVLDSSVLCITSRQGGSSAPPQPIAGDTSVMNSSNVSIANLRSELQNLQVDVLVGASNGAVTVISGEANESGGVKEPMRVLRKGRKMLHLWKSREEMKDGNVNCISAIADTFWCGFRRWIVVLQRKGWKEIARLDGSWGCAGDSPDRAEIVQLMASEHGVWSALSCSLTISLWNTDHEMCKPKLHINCCSYLCSEIADYSPQFTALHLSYPFLFAGTNKGDLLTLRIQKKDTLPRHTPTPLVPNSPPTPHAYSKNDINFEYKMVTAEHCGPVPILGIFASPLALTLTEDRQSPFRSKLTTPTSLQVLVFCGETVNGADISTSQVLLYELFTTPLPSPLTSPGLFSPFSLPRSPPVFSNGSSPSPSPFLSSSSSLSSSSLSQRRRHSSGTFNGILPKLSLVSASPSSLSLLPLRTS